MNIIALIVLVALLAAAGVMIRLRRRSGRSTVSTPAQFPAPVRTLEYESGLKADVLKEGSGGEAAAHGHPVAVHYTGWLTDGTKFDSSRTRGNPFTFALGAGNVIKGWDEGVNGMKVGEKRVLTIPPKLAYGNRPAGRIPAGSTLVFEIELLRIG